MKAAAVRRSSQQLDILRECVKRMGETLHDLDAFLYYDSKFHLTLMEAAGNKTALGVYKVLYRTLSDSDTWRKTQASTEERIPGSDELVPP